MIRQWYKTYGYNDCNQIKKNVANLAIRFFKLLLKGQGGTTLEVVIDKLASYSAAKKELNKDLDSHLFNLFE